MSDELFASIVTVGLIAALSLWVPALDLLRHVVRKQAIQGRETE
jgi:hypothetical protein